MTEMTKHMMTAMTMPTYSATSSVLGAARGDTEEKKKDTVLNSVVLIEPSTL